MTLHRRHFLAASAAALPALTAAGAADKPNEKIVLALIGVNGRGRDLLKSFPGFDEAEIGGLRGPHENVVPKGLAAMNAKQKREPKVVQDLRKVFDDKDINAVVVA